MPVAAMSAMPVASPSTPSIKLNAFISATNQNIVAIASTHSGNAKPRMFCSRMPDSKAAAATTTCPANFTIGLRSSRSSNRPSSTTPALTGRNRIHHAMDNWPANGCQGNRNTTAQATWKPANTARLPPRGTGSRCTLRRPGRSRKPQPGASRRHSGVSAQTASRPARNTAGYLRMASRVMDASLRCAPPESPIYRNSRPA